MLARLTDYLLAFLELLELEMRSLKAGMVRVGTSLAFAVAGVGLLAAAAGVFGWAVYTALIPYWGRAGSAAACGALLAVLGGGFVWLASSRTGKS